MAGPTISAPPNIFDQMANMQAGQDTRAKYGGDPTAGTSPYSQYAGESRQPGLGAQANALEMYRQQALGLGPSVAQQQMQQGLGQSQRAALAMAAQGRGGNIAGMQQAALNAGSGLAAGVNQQASLLRAQEQQAAMQGYAGLGSQLYQQGFNYDQLANQASQFNAQNTLDWYLGKRGLDLQRDAQNKDWTMGLVQAGAGLAGGIMGGAAQLSDERAKDNISPTLGSVSQAVGEATPVTFDYKPGLGPYGQQVGFTAQDLERTPLGPQLVVDTPNGKFVNTGNAAMASLAGVAELRQELDQLRAANGLGPVGAQAGSTMTQQYLRQGLG